MSPRAEAACKAAMTIPGRSPRSDIYWMGVRCSLLRVLDDVRVGCPYSPGSVEFDAYVAGQDEGAAIARRTLQAEQDSPPNTATSRYLPAQNRAKAVA